MKAYTLDTLKKEIMASRGEQRADLVLHNIQLVDVYTNEIRPGALAIYNEKIVAVDPESTLPAKEYIDGRGQYAVPGLIDSHIHLETTLLTPHALSEVIAPWGTTTLLVDAMEIANVAGIEGLLALLEGTEHLAFRMYLEIPSRVPTMPGFETTGGVLGPEEVLRLMHLPETVSLGELDPSKILELSDSHLEKVLHTLSCNKICNGHAIGLTAQELNTYAAGHMMDDHESVCYEDLLHRLRVGMRVMLREGSSERNVQALMQGVLAHGLPTENLLFCTDDKHATDISREGHISANVQCAIDLGLDPVAAIKMATINAARHFRIDHLVGSLTPGRFADILLLEDLKVIKPSAVFKSGALFYANGTVKRQQLKEYAPSLLHTVILNPQLKEAHFQIPCKGTRALCRVISMIPDQIVNTEEQHWLPVEDGRIAADVTQDILKLSVLERYGKNGNVKSAFVKGFSLQHGALASSVSHDHHNVVIVGTNDHDMLLAAKELERLQGGFAAVQNGKLLGSIALPLGGLMSLLPAEQVLEEMDRLNGIVRQMGCDMHAPFMSLSFISLPTVPALGLTDQGLVDVLRHNFTELILKVEE